MSNPEEELDLNLDIALFDENEGGEADPPKKQKIKEEKKPTALQQGKTVIWVPYHDEDGNFILEHPLTLEEVTPTEMIAWGNKVFPGCGIEKAKLKTVSDRQGAFDFIVFLLNRFNLSARNHIPRKKKQEKETKGK